MVIKVKTSEQILGKDSSKSQKMFSKDISYFAPKEFQIFKKDLEKGDSYFAPLFNFLYYLLVCPFRVEKSVYYGVVGHPEEHCYYVLKSNKLQKFGCIILHLTQMFQMPILIYKYCFQIFLSSSTDISKLFDDVGNCSCVLAVACFLKLMWWDRNAIWKFLNVSRVGPIFEGWSARSTNLVILGICSYLYINHLWYSAYIIYEYDLTKNSLFWVFGPEPSNETSATQEMLDKDENISSTSWIQNLLWLLELLFCLILNQSICMYSMSRLIVMILALQLKPLSNHFVKCLERESHVKKVVETYDSMRCVVEKACAWTKWLILLHCIGILTFLAYIPALRASKTGVSNCYMVYVYVTYGSFLIIACEMTNRIRNAGKKWIIRRRLQEGLSTEDRLLMVSFSQELDTEPLGLSCTFFTITYSFVSSMAGLVTTYGILVYQMRK